MSVIEYTGTEEIFNFLHRFWSPLGTWRVLAADGSSVGSAIGSIVGSIVGSCVGSSVGSATGSLKRCSK